MSIDSEEMALLTARAGIGRAGCMRAAYAPKAFEMWPDGSGRIIWRRPAPPDGDPDDTPSTWTTVRE